MDATRADRSRDLSFFFFGIVAVEQGDHLLVNRNDMAYAERRVELAVAHWGGNVSTTDIPAVGGGADEVGGSGGSGGGCTWRPRKPNWSTRTANTGGGSGELAIVPGQDRAPGTPGSGVIIML